MSHQYVNPDTLFPSLQYGFSQGVIASGTKTLYLAGQTAWDAEQNIIGGSNLGQQTRQALRNMEAAVTAAGGSRADIVSLRLYLVRYDLKEGSAVSEALREFFPAETRPAATWIGVDCLASPDFLIEIEAIAVLQQ